MRSDGVDVIRSPVALLESVLQDTRYTVRKLRRNWGFTLLAVLTLSLGIGATTAVFSVVNGVLLRPLPYPESGRLIAIAEQDPKGGEMNAASGNFADMRAQSHVFDGLAAYAGDFATVLGGAEPSRAYVAQVSDDFFPVLGVPAVVGRQFTRDEFARNGPRAVVVSFDFWQSQLGGTHALGDRTLDIAGTRYQVVGVMPRGFNFPEATDMWATYSFADATSRSGHVWSVIGRLKPDVDIGRARTELAAIYGRLKRQYWHAGPARSQYDDRITATGFTIRSLHDALVGSVQKPLLLLLCAAAVVLLVACTNVASTLLASGAARRGELATRFALGATRARVLRQLTTEGLLLAMLGVVVGLALSETMVRVLLALAPAHALPGTADVHLDARVIAFAVLVGIAATVLSSVLPALRTSRASIGSELSTRGEVGGSNRVWSILVGVEVALALLLLVGAGLVAKSFARVVAIDPGFRSNGVLTAQIALPESAYPDNESVAVFYAELLPQLRAIRGVTDVGLSHDLPLAGKPLRCAFEVEGRGPISGHTDYDVATSGYFRALGIPLERGRLFDDGDRPGKPDVALVSETFAKRYWPGENPIGKRIRNFTVDNGYYPDRWVTVIGVVGDVRSTSMTDPAPPMAYVDEVQRPFRARYAYLTFRSTVPPSTLIGAVRARLQAVSGDRIPAEFQTMDERTSGSVAGRRFSTSILGSFAVIALILAAIGIYGVVSYQVVQRTREIGIRMALGAQPVQVRNMVVGNSMRVVAAGLVAGVIATPLLTRLIRSVLYGVSPADPVTFGWVVLLFCAVAAVASLIPAHRATRIDPVVALRSE